MVIAPWNYPFLTAVNSIVPALMAGNAVILKHASQTLLVGERFAEAFKAAGLPDGLFQNLVLSHADTEKLIASGADRPHQLHRLGRRRPPHRARRGRHLRDARARARRQGPGLCARRRQARLRGREPRRRLVLQLRASPAAASSASMCTRDVYDKFVDGFVENAKGWTLGNPLDADTVVGPMAAAEIRRPRARADRRGAAQGRHGASQHASTISTRRARPISRPRC